MNHLAMKHAKYSSFLRLSALLSPITLATHLEAMCLRDLTQRISREREMNITIASGKGGTGKTTIALNLARVADTDTQLLDCDVEAPNDYLFFGNKLQKIENVMIKIPQVDVSQCDECEECSELCQFNAIAVVYEKAMVFPDMCHACGGCMLICPKSAISETEKNVGIIEGLVSNNIQLIQGCLDIGSTMAPTVIRAVKKHINKNSLTIIDSPPGTSCPVVTTIIDSDFVVLVTEPTPFGLNDLVLAIQLVQELSIPFGVVINRAGIGDEDVRQFCREAQIPVLTEIPDDRRIAEAYSQGKLIVDALPEYKTDFVMLLEDIIKRAQ